MKTHTPSPRQIPLDDAWDVVVVGGGPAGCAAAAAAARDGARTLLIEATGALGGMGTGGLVPSWTPFTDKQRFIYGGIARHVFETCRAGMPHIAPDACDWVPIDPELLKRIYDDLVLDAGARVLFNTHLSAVERDPATDRVNAIIVTNKSGLSALAARVFVDCTGDADLCAWAGAPFQKGDADGGRLMPATHCFIFSNVDTGALAAGPLLHFSNPDSPIYLIARDNKNYPLLDDTHICHSVLGPRTVGFNAGHIWEVDNTRPETVSDALIRGRKMAAQFLAALKEHCPDAFGEAFLAATAPLMGIRETRRIDGDYTLTLDDYIARRGFADEIARNCYYIDIHWAKDAVPLDHDTQNAWEQSCMHYGAGESHGIPCRCLMPRQLANVLVAGRAISCDQAVQSSIRVMPACLSTGEAAGTAAAMAAQRDGDIRKVDTSALRLRLAGAGAWLPGLPAGLIKPNPLNPTHQKT
ncbi:MAG: FAD-dependent oxidoreductase [Opitutaceae bacterium]|jgi:glycine/D-amino acid oxidase-like deaminating enzyme|nr:FAD-dependent oxidoreductase [Opitutaceae bacterium]